jgi:hypothetical protein
VPIVGLAYVAVVDRRKGITELVEALLTIRDMPIHLEVIGSLSKVDAEDSQTYIERMLASAPNVKFVIHGPMDPTRVWGYVKEKKLLLVSPSLLENAPTTINVAVAFNVPLLYYNTGGVMEMVTEESAKHTVLEPDVKALAKRIRECLEAGSGHVPVLTESMYKAKANWLAYFKRASEHNLTLPPPRLSPPPAFGQLLLWDNSTSTDSLADELAAVPTGLAARAESPRRRSALQQGCWRRSRPCMSARRLDRVLLVVGGVDTQCCVASNVADRPQDEPDADKFAQCASLVAGEGAVRGSSLQRASLQDEQLPLRADPPRTPQHNATRKACYPLALCSRRFQAGRRAAKASNMMRLPSTMWTSLDAPRTPNASVEA